MKYGTFKYGEQKYGKETKKLEFVTDRTLNDVLTKKAKGFLTTADMNRISGNINEVTKALGITDEVKTARTDYTDGEWLLKEYFQEWADILNAVYAKIKNKIPSDFGWDVDVAQLNYATLNKIESCIEVAYNTII